MDVFDFARRVKEIIGNQFISLTITIMNSGRADISIHGCKSANEAELLLRQISNNTITHDNADKAHWCTVKERGYCITAFYEGGESHAEKSA